MAWTLHCTTGCGYTAPGDQLASLCPSCAQPLAVHISLQGEWLVVRNARQPRRSALPSAGLGLANLDERCRLLTGQGLLVLADTQSFEVRLPTLAGAS